MEKFKIGSRVYVKNLFTPFVLVSNSPCLVVPEEDLLETGFADPIPVNVSDLSFNNFSVNLNDKINHPIYGPGVVKDISRKSTGFVGVKYDIGKYDENVPIEKFVSNDKGNEELINYNIRQCGITGAFVLPSLYCKASNCEYCDPVSEKCVFDPNEFLKDVSKQSKKEKVVESQPKTASITEEELLKKIDFDQITTKSSFIDTVDFNIGDKVYNEKIRRYGKVLIIYNHDNCMEVQWDGCQDPAICWFSEVKKVVTEKFSPDADRTII